MITSVTAPARVLTASTLALLLSSACGGSSFTPREELSGGTSAGGVGSSGSAGKAGSSAGGSSSGGSSAGGSSSMGGGAGVGNASSGGNGTAGADPGGRCSGPPASGNCNAAFQRWYHDASTGVCRPFTYGGCGGNENNYESLAACQEACATNHPNYDACSVASDCAVLLASANCCGICDRPRLTAWDMVAVNKQHTLAVTQCALGALPPGDLALPCAPCPTLTDASGSLKFFVPNCRAGQCVVEDVRTSVVSACETDADCRVRNGNDCCESCGVIESIAVNRSGAFEKLVCGAMPPGCPECEPGVGNATAVCGPNRQCELVYPTPG